MIYRPNGYAMAVDRAVLFIPISDTNVYTLLHGKTLEEYMSFFVEHYGDKVPELIARWRISMDDSKMMDEAEDILIEKAIDLMPDEEWEEIEEIEETEEVEDLEDADEMQSEDTDDLTDENPDNEPEIQETESEIDNDKAIVTNQSPQEITLDYLMERRRQADLEEKERKDEEAKSLEQRRKDAAILKKQQEKERKQLLRQKAKQAKEREKQRKKELKDRERLNKQRQKEREAQRKADQRAKTNAVKR
jgi:hypothetical protein